MSEHSADYDAGYQTIVVDPPWAYPGPGGHPKSSTTHRPNSGAANIGATSDGRYGSMSLDELAALQVGGIAAPNAHLYLWTTNKFIAEAHDLCRAWGFRPITVLTWGKVKADGTPSMKIGHYYRGATEHVVFGVKGSLGLSTKKALPTLMLWPRTTGHSIKPDAFFDMVEDASPGPRAELFARKPRPGWDVWGNEVPCDFSPVAEQTYRWDGGYAALADYDGQPMEVLRPARVPEEADEEVGPMFLARFADGTENFVYGDECVLASAEGAS